MAILEPHDPGDVGLVFVAHNNHDERCGPPPRLRNTDNPGLYHGYFENCHGERFVFTFDRATKAGTVSGGDLSWNDPKAFMLDLLDEALRSTQNIAAQVVSEGRDEASAHVGQVVRGLFPIPPLAGIHGMSISIDPHPGRPWTSRSPT